MADEQIDVLWRPSEQRREHSQMQQYMHWLQRERGLGFDDFESLWQWSVDDLEAFWASIWDYFDVRHSARHTRVLDSHTMPGAHWFEGARLNAAEQIFQFNHGPAAAETAILSRSESRGLQELSWGELRGQIASLAERLRAMGVGKGDRVVAYMPNIPETAVAFWACASIGAIWSVCSPDMGSRSVLDRFQQIDPKVLIAVDGYRYGGKDVDCMEVVGQLREGLPTLEQFVLLPVLDPGAALDGGSEFSALIADDVVDFAFEQVEFEHPLWVVYSSGTTGMPKPIVHGHGGVLLEMLKHLSLHLDLGADDRFMWFTTSGWMMWNLQMCGLMVGATVCLYDGNPGHPNLETLWRFAEEAGMTVFGAGAAYYDGCRKARIEPAQVADLKSLRSLGSTGSPLSPETSHWMMEHINPDAMITPASGGTDIVSGFVTGCPIKPVVAGEMQARGLGVAAYAFDDAGNALDDEVGELVVTKPMPSMPLYFWGDADGSRLRSSYFETYPGYWRHGDWIRITPRGGAVIYGRSDSTINRHGIRIGTSELYRVVESFAEVVDSLIVDLEYLSRKSWMPLFLVLEAGSELDDSLVRRINQAIKEQVSPRFVPNAVFVVPEIPRTLTGKKMEVPVKKLLLGMPLAKAASPDAMANPQALDFFIELASRRQANREVG